MTSTVFTEKALEKEFGIQFLSYESQNEYADKNARISFSQILSDSFFKTPEVRSFLQELINDTRNSFEDIVTKLHDIPQEIISHGIRMAVLKMLNNTHTTQEELIPRITSLFEPPLPDNRDAIFKNPFPDIILPPKVKKELEEECEKFNSSIRAFCDFRNTVNSESAFFAFYEKFKFAYQEKNGIKIYSLLQEILDTPSLIIPKGKEELLAILFFLPHKHRKLLENVFYVQNILPLFKEEKSTTKTNQKLKKEFTEYLKTKALTYAFEELSDSTSEVAFATDIIKLSKLQESIQTYPKEETEELLKQFEKSTKNYRTKLMRHYQNIHINELEFYLKIDKEKISNFSFMTDIVRILGSIQFYSKGLNINGIAKLYEINKEFDELEKENLGFREFNTRSLTLFEKNRNLLETLSQDMKAWLLENNNQLYELLGPKNEAKSREFMNSDVGHGFQSFTEVGRNLERELQPKGKPEEGNKIPNSKTMIFEDSPYWQNVLQEISETSPHAFGKLFKKSDEIDEEFYSSDVTSYILDIQNEDNMMAGIELTEKILQRRFASTNNNLKPLDILITSTSSESLEQAISIFFSQKYLFERLKYQNITSFLSRFIQTEKDINITQSLTGDSDEFRTDGKFILFPDTNKQISIRIVGKFDLIRDSF